MLFCPCSSEWGEAVTDSMGPHLTPPVASPFFLLPCRLSLCLQGAEQEGYHFPSQSRAGFLNGALTVTRGNLRPAAAARRAPSLSVPICAILQSGGKSYLPGLEAGGGGSWRRGGRLQVLWVLQKAQGSVQQQLVGWTGFRVKSGMKKACLGIKKYQQSSEG